MKKIFKLNFILYDSKTHTNTPSQYHLLKNNRHFITLYKAVKDPLILPRLEFFKTPAQPLSKFLCSFQSESPLIPFLAEEIVSIHKELLRRFILSETVDGLSSAKVVNFDLEDSTKYCSSEQIDIGTAVKVSLLKCADTTTAFQRQEFRQQCRIIF